MLVGLSGPTFTLNPGDEYPNCDPAEAARLVAAGFAVIEDAAPAKERAIRKPTTEKRKA